MFVRILKLTIILVIYLCSISMVQAENYLDRAFYYQPGLLLGYPSLYLSKDSLESIRLDRDSWKVQYLGGGPVRLPGFTDTWHYKCRVVKIRDYGNEKYHNGDPYAKVGDVGYYAIPWPWDIYMEMKNKSYDDMLMSALKEYIEADDTDNIRRIAKEFTHSKVSFIAKKELEKINKREAERKKRIAEKKEKSKRLLLAKYKESEDNIKLMESFVNAWRKNSRFQSVSYKSVISKAQYNKLIDSIYTYYRNLGSINDYVSYIDKHPNTKQAKIALDNIFNFVKKENNISGFEWFINKYPKSKHIKESINRIHQLAFDKAKDINTISAYNTFIITYPYAKETKQAIQVSYDLEKNNYSKLRKNDEGKARLLAVRIKKLTIRMNKETEKNRDGYKLVIDRMGRLLTERFEATDASLRYYESKEFTDFASNFDSTMKNIMSVMHRIEKNTSNLGSYAKQILKVAQNGFDNAKSDRAMSEYYAKQHRDWEKFMHLKKYGYE